jgi:hypothetical protein
MPGWDIMVMERLDELSGKIEGLSKEIEDIKKNLNQEENKEQDFEDYCKKFEEDIFIKINDSPSKYCISDLKDGDVFNGILCFALSNGEFHIHTYPFRCVYKNNRYFGILGIRDIGDFIKAKDKDFEGFSWEEANEIKFKAFFYDSFENKVISKWVTIPSRYDIEDVGDFSNLISTGFIYWTSSHDTYYWEVSTGGGLAANDIDLPRGVVPFAPYISIFD